MQRRAIAAFAVPLLFAACMTPPDAYKAKFTKEGKPPAYLDGHGDGCRSGFNAAGNPFPGPF